MGRAPCCDKANVKRGPWSPEEDATLKNYLHKFGTGGNWISLPQRAGLKRCGKSCRLRWLNYLRPDIKHGAFSDEEDNIIISLYCKMGSRWSVIAANLPGRTDNDVKNHWNTKLKKKLFGRSNNNKFNPSTTPNLTNNPFTNNKIVTNSITQVPSTSSPSPSYLDNNDAYNQVSSFSSLLAQCTSNIPMSSVPYFNTLTTNLDNSYVHDMVPTPSSTLHSFQQAQVMSHSSSAVTTTGSSYPYKEVSSISESSTSAYGSSMEDDPFLAELGFGLIQEVLMTPTCYYGDQDDIKPQGLGQRVTNY